jgi:hypothetical protein
MVVGKTTKEKQSKDLVKDLKKMDKELEKSAADHQKVTKKGK